MLDTQPAACSALFRARVLLGRGRHAEGLQAVVAGVGWGGGGEGGGAGVGGGWVVGECGLGFGFGIV